MYRENGQIHLLQQGSRIHGERSGVFAQNACKLASRGVFRCQKSAPNGEGRTSDSCRRRHVRSGFARLNGSSSGCGPVSLIAATAMPDASPYIFLQGLTVQSLIGVYPEERHGPQPLLIDVEVGLPGIDAFVSDQFRDTIDYAAVAELIRSEAGSQSFSLLERLAHHLCEAIGQRFGAPWCRIRIVKPDIVPGAAAVGVHYLHHTRQRGQSGQPA